MTKDLDNGLTFITASVYMYAYRPIRQELSRSVWFDLSSL